MSLWRRLGQALREWVDGDDEVYVSRIPIHDDFAVEVPKVVAVDDPPLVPLPEPPAPPGRRVARPGTSTPRGADLQLGAAPMCHPAGYNRHPGLATSSRGRRLLSWDRRAVRAWCPAEGRCTLEVFPPRTERAAACDLGDVLVTADDLAGVRAFDMGTGAELWRHADPFADPVLGLQVPPAGGEVWVVRGHRPEGRLSCEVLDLGSGEPRREKVVRPDTDLPNFGTRSPMIGLAPDHSPTLRVLGSNCRVGPVSLPDLVPIEDAVRGPVWWDAHLATDFPDRETLQLPLRGRVPGPATLDLGLIPEVDSETRFELHSLLGPRALLARPPGRLAGFDLTDGSLRWVVPSPVSDRHSVVAAPSGDWFAVTDDRGWIYVLETASGAIRGPATGPGVPVVDVDVRTDGQVVSLGEDRRARLWFPGGTEAPKVQGVPFEEVHALACAPDSASAYVAGTCQRESEGNVWIPQVSEWGVAQIGSKATLTWHPTARLLFGPDAPAPAVLEGCGAARRLRRAPRGPLVFAVGPAPDLGRHRVTVVNSKVNRVVASFQTSRPGPVHLSPGPDGESFLLAEPGQDLALYSIPDWEPRRTFPVRAEAAALSPDGSRLAVLDADLALYSTEPFRKLATTPRVGGGRPAASLEFLPEGDALVLRLHHAHQAFLIEVAPGGEGLGPTRPTARHADRVTGAALDPTGRALYTSSRDGTVLRTPLVRLREGPAPGFDLEFPDPDVDQGWLERFPPALPMRWLAPEGVERRRASRSATYPRGTPLDGPGQGRRRAGFFVGDAPLTGEQILELLEVPSGDRAAILAQPGPVANRDDLPALLAQLDDRLRRAGAIPEGWSVRQLGLDEDLFGDLPEDLAPALDATHPFAGQLVVVVAPPGPVAGPDPAS